MVSSTGMAAVGLVQTLQDEMATAHAAAVTLWTTAFLDYSLNAPRAARNANSPITAANPATMKRSVRGISLWGS